jgi:hypothetical protein
MARLIRLIAAASLDKLAAAVDALNDLGITVVVGSDDAAAAGLPAADDTDSTPERLTVRPSARLRREAAERPASRGDNGGQRRRGGARSVYHATAKAQAEAKRGFPNVTDRREAVLRSIIRYDGHGMSWHQDKLAGKIEPKTVDGSIYWLRTNGYVKSVDAK